MADLINFTLPSINENMDAKTMKQIKNYLFQLTEQMKFYLNNIDTDNFTDAYNQHLSKMATSQTTNANQMSVTQQQLKAFENNYNYSIKQAVDKISGNNGGYIVTLDTNGDGMPDDLRILADTSNYVTSKKYWQFNRAGLAYIERTNGTLTSSLALSADGYIIADRVKGNLGEFVTLNACTLNACNINACTGSFSGQISADSGKIGYFNIVNEKNTVANVYKGGLYADYIGDVHSYRTFVQSAYYDSNVGNAGETWVFSSQHADVTNGSVGRYSPTWYVKANGDTYQKGMALHYGDINITSQYHLNTDSVRDTADKNLIGVIGGNTVVGLGEQGRNTRIYTTQGFYIDFVFNTISDSLRMAIYDSDIALQCYRSGASIKLMSGLKLNFHAISGLLGLYVNTNGLITGSSSSMRYKENITSDLESFLNPEKLLELPIVQYNYKPEYREQELVAGTQIGFTAEDINQYYPNACIYNDKGQAENWQERIIIPAMLKLIQEQNKQIKKLYALIEK